jgi:hypothetical protein
MIRTIYEVASILSLIAALGDASRGVAHGVASAWILFVAPCLVYGVITISQFLPVTSLNLTVKVTPENTARVVPAVRDFLAALKALTMLLIYCVTAFAISSVQESLFFVGVGAALVAILAQVFGFLTKIKKLA